MNAESSPTPILDLLVPLPEGKKENSSDNLNWRQIVFILAGIFLIAPGLALFVFRFPKLAILAIPVEHFFHEYNAQMSQIDNPLLPILLPFATLYFCVFLHEIGHVCAGLMTGATFRGFWAGPLGLQVIDQKWRLKFRLKSAGSAIVKYGLPGASSAKLAIFIFGGPLANLITWLIVKPFLGTDFLSPAMLTSLYLISGWSLFFFVVNLVPIRSKGFFSDGARLWMLAFSKLKAERWFAIQNLSAEIEAGVDVRNLNPGWVKAAIAVDDNSRDTLSAQMLTYFNASGLKDYEAAASRLERWLSLAYMADGIRNVAILEAAVFQAWVRGNAEKAERWHLKVKDDSKLSLLLRKRVSIAIHVAKHEYETALAEWKECFALLEKLPESKRARMQQGLQEWKVEIEERAKAADPQLASDASSSSN